MYLLLLSLHSIVRWVVLIAGVVAFILALRGWLGKRQWTRLDDRLGLVFTSALDTQLLLGLLLYVVSPLIRAIFADFGAAMGVTGQRFFALEHALLMVIAVVVAHVGRARIRRTAEATVRHRQAALFFGLALVLIVLAIPWPFAPAARPLFRLQIG